METNRLNKSQFPELLQQISSLPPFLETAGAPLPCDRQFKYLCVVGSRKYSEYGENACMSLISGLAGYPIVVVSGLAIGIDSIAHLAALESGLKTVSFPGSGLSPSVLYPPSHLNLAKRITDNGGTLISPFEANQVSTRWTFPVRNRLMAGISHATLVIEGAKGSGTLLTAYNALEFNRDVMVVPGSIFSDLTYAPHVLQRDGASPVLNSREILRILGFDVPEDSLLPETDDGKATMPISGASNIQAAPYENLTADELKIIEILKFGSRSATDIGERSKLAVSRQNILLTQLELKGLITENEGLFRLARATSYGEQR